MTGTLALLALDEVETIFVLCYAHEASAVACIADYIALIFFLQHRITPSSILHKLNIPVNLTQVNGDFK